MGSTFAIIGFAIWPDLPRTQSLNHAIKTLPAVSWRIRTQYSQFAINRYSQLKTDLQYDQLHKEMHSASTQMIPVDCASCHVCPDEDRGG